MRTVLVKINYSVDDSLRRYRAENKDKYSKIDSSKYVLWGGTYKRRYASLILQANSYEDAEELAYNNPFMGSNNYFCEIVNRGEHKICS
ncbi:MAG: hypothetical protein ACRDD2_00110 [Sarcina sp.]